MAITAARSGMGGRCRTSCAVGLLFAGLFLFGTTHAEIPAYPANPAYPAYPGPRHPSLHPSVHAWGRFNQTTLGDLGGATEAMVGSLLGFGGLALLSDRLLPLLPGEVTALCPPLGALAVILFVTPEAPAAQVW